MGSAGGSAVAGAAFAAAAGSVRHAVDGAACAAPVCGPVRELERGLSNASARAAAAEPPGHSAAAEFVVTRRTVLICERSDDGTIRVRQWAASAGEAARVARVFLRVADVEQELSPAAAETIRPAAVRAWASTRRRP